MSTAKEMTGAERKAKLLEVGANLSAKHGAANVNIRMVAEKAKCSEALVRHYMGSSVEAQKAYRRKMKSLGLSEPDKDKIEAIGIKLRAHGPRDARDTRKRSAKEVEAIKRKKAAPAAKKATVKVVAKTGNIAKTAEKLKALIANPTVKVVAKKAIAKRAIGTPTKPESKAKPAPENKAKVPPENKAKPTAARMPKAPPPNLPELPAIPEPAALPPLPMAPIAQL